MVDRIRLIIKNFFNTQVAFAEYLQITKQQVTRYLNGDNYLPISVIIKLANDYKINPTWLLLGKGNMLLSDTEKASTAQHIQELNDKIKELEIENKLLKELIKK